MEKNMGTIIIGYMEFRVSGLKAFGLRVHGFRNVLRHQSPRR